jgi:hypothetical protein
MLWPLCPIALKVRRLTGKRSLKCRIFGWIFTAVNPLRRLMESEYHFPTTIQTLCWNPSIPTAFNELVRFDDLFAFCRVLQSAQIL